MFKLAVVLTSLLLCSINPSWASTQLNCTWDGNGENSQDQPDLMIRLSGEMAVAVFNDSFVNQAPEFGNFPGGANLNYRRSIEFSTAATSVYLRVYSAALDQEASELPVLQISNVSRPGSPVLVKITESSTTQSDDDLSFNCTQVVQP